MYSITTFVRFTQKKCITQHREAVANLGGHQLVPVLAQRKPAISLKSAGIKNVLRASWGSHLVL